MVTKIKEMIARLLGGVKAVMLSRRFIVVTIIECLMLFCSVRFSVLTLLCLDHFNMEVALHMQLVYIILAITSILISALLCLINTKEECETTQPTIRVDRIKDVVAR